MTAQAQAAARGLFHARPAAHASEGERDATGDGLMRALLGLYLASLAAEGILRYVLATWGAPNAIYLRDAIPLATLAVLLVRPLLYEGRIDLAIALPLTVLAVHAVWAALLGVSFFAIAFGLKIFMFVPYGIAMWPLVRRRLRACLGFATALFAVTAAGVFANALIGRMPWEGLQYDTAFGQVSSTRLWWVIEGVARVPGFTRSSFNAAMILGITGLLAMVRLRSMPARLAIVGGAFGGILLTTSKGMILAFPLAAAWLLLMGSRRATGAAIVGAVALVTAAIPLLVTGFDLADSMNSSKLPRLLVSVWQRFTDMWPKAFALLPDGPAALLGAGPGAIGTPQLFGDAPHKFNAGDNFPLYLLVTFGMAGLLYFALPALAMARVAARQGATLRAVYVGLLLIGYGYGMSINMVEDSFFAITFGLCCGLAVASSGRRVPERGRS